MNYENRIKELREKNHLTQSDIAKILKISRGTYSHYETENIIIPINHLVSLCEYFNASLDFIFMFTSNHYSDFNNISKEISGKRLKQWRRDNGLTQEDLAKMLNTNRSVIANYERGRNFIATSFLYDICKKYNISADYLLGRVDEPKFLK